ncbi:hypothetical protein LPB140_07930 [Sphingorhabdus lutea]|uniref:Lysoplasmalogenase n=2 Tax=Sphingorhabdus lutea TaxID=1913578 RepID=A0A1L3JF71_9SPHN|nr:hypothetical protein LPB140_07930 [Sphingorhabdus lutea]
MDLGHQRPWLLLSLLFGLSYYFIRTSQYFGEIQLMFWKMAAVGGLAIMFFFMFRKHLFGPLRLILFLLALIFYMLGDGLIIFDLTFGGAAFAIGHIFAIIFFYNYRREQGLSLSQKLLAMMVVILVPFIAMKIYGNGIISENLSIGLYALIIAMMSASAWTSSFGRYRVGIGAMIFIISDLFIFAQNGIIGPKWWIDPIIWFSYYFAVLMMTLGVNQKIKVMPRI